MIEVKSRISFEETKSSVIMFVEFTHPHKTTGEWPLKTHLFFEFSKGSDCYKSIEEFFK